MSAYNEAQLSELLDEVEAIPLRATVLVDQILAHTFGTQKAGEVARHGLARRIDSMSHSNVRAFQEVPPNTDRLRSKKRRIEATVHIQSVSINTYGCFDNLAQIWGSERNVVHTNGKPLPPGRIGFSANRTDVRNSLPDELRSEIAKYDEWFLFLEEFRHSTAHNIPPYIPPFTINPKKVDEYNKLEGEANAAANGRDWARYDMLLRDQRKLGKFQPILALSVHANRTAYFHPQLLADFSTVEDWSIKILHALEGPYN